VTSVWMCAPGSVMSGRAQSRHGLRQPAAMVHAARFDLRLAPSAFPPFFSGAGLRWGPNAAVTSARRGTSLATIVCMVSLSSAISRHWGRMDR